MDVNFGKIKAKFGGSNAGHNGIASIDKFIGKEYSRVRIGIGHPKNNAEVADHVLHDFNDEEKEHIESTKDALEVEKLEIEQREAEAQIEFMRQIEEL